MAEVGYGKLDIEKTLKESFLYFVQNSKKMTFYVLVNMFLVLFAKFIVGDFSNPFFLVWLLVYYVFWSVFFRSYFCLFPCYKHDCIFHSLVPSTKIFLLTFLVLGLLLSLPMLPLFIAFIPNLPLDVVEFIDDYSMFLQKYMEDSDVLDLVVSFIFVFAAPIVCFRPFYAWISSVTGKSGSISIAFKKTKHNYWRFFFCSLIMNLCFISVREFSELVGGFSADAQVSDAVTALVWGVLSSPFIVYFNVFIAKSYEFFFVEK
ncbi:MAG: hypothetical protein PHE89_07655 [Alphaproteobacteria bacterium]|nr:hypothetical protein [Alphaproteobacteria bacterium]